MSMRALEPSDRETVAALMIEQWGADLILVHDEQFVPSELPGFVALDGEKWLGLVTYRIDGDQCEIITLNSFDMGKGIGSALIEAVAQAARAAGCRRLWLITTNDNLEALRFYQRRGMALVAVHRDAVTRARERKPSIPLIGEHGIPLRDEIELEMLL